MQVQSRLPPGLPQHPSSDPQAQTHPHSTLHHPHPRADYSSSSTDHAALIPRPSPMQPYHPQQQQYAAGSQSSPLPQQHQQQQQHPQHRQHLSNQLPPMYPSMALSPLPLSTQSGASMQGPSAVAPNAMYHPGAMGGSSLPPPPLSNPPKHQPHGMPGTEKKQLSVTGSNGKYNFELKVEQQPARARMCGFGDKDRRPITPPPCVKLVITDIATGMPVTADDIGHDGYLFVLIVDLWDDNAVREVNLVRSSSTSPAASISNASMTSYPPVPERPPQAMEYPGMAMTGAVQPIYQIGPAGGQPMYQHAPPTYPGMGGAHYANSAYGYPMSVVPSPAAPSPHHYQNFNSASSYQHNSGMYTRNLIGSLSVNASLLKDLDGNEGFWFVLQDLSVRTEGFFRLKLNFLDVQAPEGEGLNKGRSAVIASAFTDVFQVYSAKKFPGVIESTPLSKCFASQGIKIPIRKDVKPEREDDDDY